MLHQAFRFLQSEPCLTDVTLFRGDTIHSSNCKERSVIETLFYQARYTTQNETFYTLRQGSYHYFLFKSSDDKSWAFIIRVACNAFSCLEKEYVKNLLSQICIIRDKLHSDICDPTIITSLHTIISNQNNILFVKSARQYVELYTAGHRPELLAISLKRVSHYLNDQLMKVHRSYLINPKEIDKIRRKKRGRYEIVINNHIIPVGELYLPVLRHKLSHWFN